MMSPTISIAMATYNGAKYLQEQLDSLANQSLLPHELVICDDCSTDDTLDIAERFASESPFPVRIIRNERNLGYADNFLKAASLCKGDWIAFCDQDDVWFTEKLLTVSKQFNENVLLVVHAADLTDSALERTGKRWPKIAKSMVRGSLQSRLWWTPAGFTQCFSASLIRKFNWKIRPRDFNYQDRTQAHDKWTYFLANAFGSVVYIKDSLAYYRRHDNAETGNYQTSLGKRLKSARAAGASYYAMLAGVASEYGCFLEMITPPGHVESMQSEIAQNYYRTMSEIYQLRSELHSSSSFGGKFKPFAQLCRRGAYTSPWGKGLGLKAFVKDLVTLL